MSQLNRRSAEIDFADEFEAPAPADSGLSLDRIPELRIALDEDGQDAYWKWSYRLLERGLLDDLSLETVVSLALCTTEINTNRAAGKAIRYPSENRDRALKRLGQLFNERGAVPKAGATSEFAHFGFARRARSRRHG